MATKSNTRRSYARPTVRRYHFRGCVIDLVPENHDSKKWHVVTPNGTDLGNFATLGASERAITKYRTSTPA